ncbi:hypothetical protein ACH3VR_12890 [Microbacterium sp. B2969]|uniref:Contractile injection system tube protein N-terminal domain-containing protein n=1 Tax=Microbacterium alkaliflavum TaxID=3248839 RepID=A0ABW7Q8Q6_9MICO
MTTTLVPATLTKLADKAAGGKNGSRTYEAVGKPFEVQFNPTTLKISRTNNIDKGGSTTKTQKRQVPSVQPATLTFDLEFDTAEGGPDGRPKDVRDLTRIVRQFTEPNEDDPKKPPPAMRFQWGSFMFQGIVTQLTEDLDYFAPTGMPLRAKVSVTVTEVNPKWDAGDVGAASRNARAAVRLEGKPKPAATGGATRPTPPPGSGPGSSPTSNPISTALAQAGESVQQLLTRLDQDPATWRSAMAGLDSPLSLAAGTPVQLGASASASAGIGTGAGVGVGAAAVVSAGGGFTSSAGVDSAGAVRAALGFEGTAALGGGASAEANAGFVLAEAGGIARAGARVDAAAALSAEASARAAFAVPAGRADAQAGVGLSAQARAGATAQVDARSLTYGRGIPLRARVSGDAAATLGK